MGDEDSAWKARVLACLARELFLSEVQERTRAARLSAAAVEIARRVGDDATLAVCLLASYDTIWLPATAQRRRRAGPDAYGGELAGWWRRLSRAVGPRRAVCPRRAGSRTPQDRSARAAGDRPDKHLLGTAFGWGDPGGARPRVR